MEKIIKDNQVIFKFKSDLVASRLEELVSKARNYFTEETNYQEVVIDLSDIQKVDSKGVTFVISIYKNTLSMGKKFKVIGVNADVYWLFQLMKLDTLFPVETL